MVVVMRVELTLAAGALVVSAAQRRWPFPQQGRMWNLHILPRRRSGQAIGGSVAVYARSRESSQTSFYNRLSANPVTRRG